MKCINRLIIPFITVVILSLIPCIALGQQERTQIPVGNSVPKGPADAPVTIFEFLDFQ